MSGESNHRGGGAPGPGGRGGEDSDRKPRGPKGTGPGPKGRSGGGGPPRPGGPRPTGSLRVAAIGGNRFEMVHPTCVRAAELDYEEGMEIWKAGDPEGARDALRYALGACRDNLWVHVALGRIALEEFRDASLARGHFGYAVELGQRAFPPQFRGILAPDRRGNRPFYEAMDGLIGSLESLGKAGEAAEVRALRDRLSGGRPPGGRGASGRTDPGV